MKKLVVSQFLSLDGVMGSPEKWNAHYMRDPELVQELIREQKETDVLLFGRTTYDFFAERWPSRDGELADLINGQVKYLVSSSESAHAWSATTRLHGDTLASVKRLKNESGKNILILGSQQLVQTLMTEDLVDIYQLYIFPTLVGEGERLFKNPAISRPMHLMSHKIFQSGILSLRYQPK